MDLITPDALPAFFNPFIYFGAIIAFFVLALFFSYRALSAEDASKRATVQTTLFWCFLGLAIVWAIVVGVMKMQAEEGAKEELQKDRASWVESHGVHARPSTVTDLEFPGEKPDDDTKFGVAQVVTDTNNIINISLAWENGEFVLYGTDGQPLEKLEG